MQPLSKQKYKKIVELKQKKGRDKYGQFVIEGLRFTGEIPFGWPVECYVATKHFIQAHATFFDAFTSPVYMADEKQFLELSDTQAPQGILAVLSKTEPVFHAEPGKKFDLYLICETIMDPGNLGAIIRSADAAGCRGVILSEECADLYNPKTLRSTMGSLFHLPVYEKMNIIKSIDSLHKNGYTVFGAHLDESINPYAVNFEKPTAVIVGNEAQGLSKNTRSCCDGLVKIPMPGKAESLNASIAASILLFEAVRQKIQSK